jgi:YtkA-like
MRVRPFFWGLLGGVCLSILLFAATVHSLAPAQLRVHLAQHPAADTPAILVVHVTDTQGLTVDGAQISAKAWMTNMNMATTAISTTQLGRGTYWVRLHLSMAGPWMIAISMQAHGFTPLHQTLLVQVSSMSLPCPFKRGTVQPPLEREGSPGPAQWLRASRLETAQNQ